jgi:hypothetical protein
MFYTSLFLKLLDIIVEWQLKRPLLTMWLPLLKPICHCMISHHLVIIGLAPCSPLKELLPPPLACKVVGVDAYTNCCQSYCTRLHRPHSIPSSYLKFKPHQVFFLLS